MENHLEDQEDILCPCCGNALDRIPVGLWECQKCDSEWTPAQLARPWMSWGRYPSGAAFSVVNSEDEHFKELSLSR